ncbi:MAG: beta-cystathionase [Planctomycetota bacterium]
MSFFRDLTDQTRTAFLAMPMQSRVIAVLLVVAISVSLGFLVRGGSTKNMVYLLGDDVHSASELTAMDIAFGDASLSGWEREGRRVKVPAESRQEFLAALKDSASLPNGLQSNVERAMAATSPFESSKMAETRVMVGKERDVAKSLEAFSDIRSATVTFTMGDRRPLQETKDKSAAVMLTPETNLPLSRARLVQIQEHVAKSFLMDVADVSVTDINSNGSFLAGDEEDPWLRRRREVEEEKRQKILRLLSDIEGVRVEVSAEIDATLDVEQTTVGYEAQPTTIEEKSRKISSKSSRPAVGGVPGTVPNAVGNRSQRLEDTAQTSDMSDDTKESKRVVGQTYAVTRTAGLMPKKITATIILPTSFYDKIWRENQLRDNPDLTVEELGRPGTAELNDLRADTEKDIKDSVILMLTDVKAGEDARPLVYVYDRPDTRSPVMVESKATEKAITWLAQSWQTMALLALGLIALLVARSAVRGNGGGTTPAEFAEGFGLELPAPPAEEDEEDEEKDSMTITGGSLQQELTQLVEANPEVAANVIRGWVGEAA